jgi:hypothetical protein
MLDLNKLWKDISDSAREVAEQGLVLGSRALDKTASTLKVAEAALRAKAEQLAAPSANPQDSGTPAQEQQRGPGGTGE